MKKLFLIAVLALITGTAFGASLTDLQVSELAAETTGRSFTSGNSVILNIWNTESGIDAKVGVSYNTSGVATSIVFYQAGIPITGTRIASGTTVDTSNKSYDTIGEVVDAINADTSGYWKASVGRDAYRAMPSANISTRTDMVADSGVTANSVAGESESTAARIMLDESDADFMTCGIAAKDNTINRIKSIKHMVHGTGSMIARIYDGDTVIYRDDAESYAYYNTGNIEEAKQSGNTVNFAQYTNGKGIASSRGKSLVLRVDRATVTNPSNTASEEGELNITITYDQVVK